MEYLGYAITAIVCLGIGVTCTYFRMIGTIGDLRECLDAVTGQLNTERAKHRCLLDKLIRKKNEG